MKLYTDGASRGNPGKAGGGIVLVDGEKVEERSIYFGVKTNNEAEYLALIEGLRLALQRGVRILRIMMDSELVVKQLQGDYRVKDSKIVPLFREARALLGNFDRWVVEHVDRGDNKAADRLANKAINLEG